MLAEDRERAFGVWKVFNHSIGKDFAHVYGVVPVKKKHILFFVWGCCWARNLGQFASLFLFFLAGRRGFTLLALLWQWWIFLRAARGRSEGGAECRCRAPAAAWLASPALKPTYVSEAVSHCKRRQFKCYECYDS